MKQILLTFHRGVKLIEIHPTLLTFFENKVISYLRFVFNGFDSKNSQHTSIAITSCSVSRNMSIASSWSKVAQRDDWILDSTDCRVVMSICSKDPFFMNDV